LNRIELRVYGCKKYAMNRILTLPFFRPNWNDARYLQIFLLTSFLLYGWLFLGWFEFAGIYMAAFTSCLLTQHFWARRKGLPSGSWKSAMISALGLCLLLKVNFWPWMFLAGVIAVSSKFLIVINRKHIFNPTNFGIVALILTGNAWISPGQWGSGELVVLLIGLGAVGVLFQVDRWDVALSFLFVLFLLEYARTLLYLGWSWDVLLHKFNSGTILLFAFFMITDPRTAPDSRAGRIIWGTMIAMLSFFLSQFFHLYKAPIIALFAVSMITPLFDRIFQGKRFQWLHQ